VGLRPHPGDLTHAEGRVILPGATLTAAWDQASRSRNTPRGYLAIQLTVTPADAGPAAPRGSLLLPLDDNPIVMIDGKQIWQDGHSTSLWHGTPTQSADDSLTVHGIGPGTHTVVVADG
jgi:hypothetical protein